MEMNRPTSPPRRRIRNFYPPLEATLGPATLEASPVGDHHHHGEVEGARHAFLLVGTRHLFICHQIMRAMPAHNWEAVFEVELQNSIRDKLLTQRQDPRVSLFLANADNSRRTIPGLAQGPDTVQADVWSYFPRPEDWGSNWPWPDPAEYQNIEVRVRRSMHTRFLDANIGDLEFERYLLFGKGREAHLYHSIWNIPDYDHVLSLREAPPSVSAVELEAGVHIDMLDLPWEAGTTHCVDPLPAGKYQACRTTRDRTPFTIDVERTHWFSTRVVNEGEEEVCPLGGDVPVLGKRG
jgi:hypothetical protein